MRTALLVIDMQQSLLADETPNRDEIVGAVQALVAATRASGMEVIWITDTRVSPDATLAAEFSPEPLEIRLEKSTSDAFESTDLEAELTILAIEHVVVCGMQSDACIGATVRAAAANGFAVTVAADAHTTHARGGRDWRAVVATENARLATLERVVVRPSEEIFPGG